MFVDFFHGEPLYKSPCKKKNLHHPKSNEQIAENEGSEKELNLKVIIFRFVELPA